MTPDFTIISDRPEIIKVDEALVLHCENGPAVKWRDGMEQYYWRGVNIPDAWIKDKQSITPDIALTWDNIEQRRCACEIIGWHNILHHPSLNAKVISRHDNPEIGTLYEVDLPDAGLIRIVKAQCATGRTFGFLVPLESETPAVGIALTYGWTRDMPISAEDFIPKLTA